MSESAIRWQRDDDGVVVLTLDDPDHSANTMNDAYVASMRTTLERLQRERDEIAGVVIASAKRTFFAGGDLNRLRGLTRENAGEFTGFLREAKAQLRMLETLGVPVVAAINGAALGAGLEIALAAHHRVVADDPRAVVGFPEVTLGILPGCGGVVRSVRLIGITQALQGILLSGRRLTPTQAKDTGIVDEIAPAIEDLIPAAKRWIAENPQARQPWDADPDHEIPGGTPSTPSFAAGLPALAANLRKQAKGANLPAPRNILAAAVEGAQVDVDNALEIETRYFVDLAVGQVAQNMIQAYFFDLNRVNGDRGRPADREPSRVEKVVVLGAGMMGSGIAYVCAKAGIEVVLKDVSLEAARRGESHSEHLIDRAVERGRSSTERGERLLALIHPTDDPKDAAGADLVIEAVFEDPGVKAQVFAEIEPHLAEGALLASNTSTLPITGLAENVGRPEDFIGMHFFSPVDRMPLLEIIRGEQTTDETTWRALDVARRISKTPIVVNDTRGFFTSRVITPLLNEATAMLLEGIPAATIEQASSQAGYPTPLLQLSDELNLELSRKIRDAARAAVEGEGGAWSRHPAEEVLERMLDEFDRPGRREGRGFYEYAADGTRAGLWKGLRDAFPPVEDPSTLSLRDLRERMLFIQAIEAVRCFDEGVIESVADANIGSLMGIGYPRWTGGVLQYVNGFDGGPAGFVARALELAARYGDRFEPPSSLVERAESGERYSDEPVGGAWRS